MVPQAQSQALGKAGRVLPWELIVSSNQITAPLVKIAGGRVDGVWGAHVSLPAVFHSPSAVTRILTPSSEWSCPTNLVARVGILQGAY